MKSKKKLKLKKKTIASLIGAAIVLLGIAHLWFYLEGISIFLRNTPSWIFHYWPSLQRWLIKQSTFSNPANCAALQRRSPAIISNLPSSSVGLTTIG